MPITLESTEKFIRNKLKAYEKAESKLAELSEFRALNESRVNAILDKGLDLKVIIYSCFEFSVIDQEKSLIPMLMLNIASASRILRERQQDPEKFLQIAISELHEHLKEWVEIHDGWHNVEDYVKNSTLPIRVALQNAKNALETREILENLLGHITNAPANTNTLYIKKVRDKLKHENKAQIDLPIISGWNYRKRDHDVILSFLSQKNLYDALIDVLTYLRKGDLKIEEYKSPSIVEDFKRRFHNSIAITLDRLGRMRSEFIPAKDENPGGWINLVIEHEEHSTDYLKLASGIALVAMGLFGGVTLYRRLTSRPDEAVKEIAKKTFGA